MSAQHPPLDRLLLARENELPAAQAASIRAHLATCAQCQANLADLDATVQGAQRRGITADRDLIEFRAHLESLDRPAPRPRAAWGQWAAAAAVVVFLVIALPILRSSPDETVVAAELLETWARRETLDRPPPSARLEATSDTDAVSVAESAGVGSCATRGPAPSNATMNTSPTFPAGVDRLLAAHCFDAHRPLSIAGYRRWYGALQTKSAAITRSAEATSITIDTPEGVIQRATLVVDERTTIVQLLALTLRSENDHTLRFRPAPEVPVPTRETLASDAAVAPRASVPASSATARPATPTIAARVQLLTLLHEHDLDRGAAEVRRTADGRVSVTVSHQRASTMKALEAEIAGMSGVVLRRDAVRKPGPIPAEPNEVVSATPGLATADINHHIPEPRAQQRFREEVSGATRTLASRLTGLEVATALVPDVRELDRLAPETQEPWWTIRHGHALAARESLVQLRATLTGAGVVLPPSSRPAYPENSCDRAGDYHDLARRIDRLTASLVGGLASGIDQPMQSVDQARTELIQAADHLGVCLDVEIARTTRRSTGHQPE